MTTRVSVQQIAALSASAQLCLDRAGDAMAIMDMEDHEAARTHALLSIAYSLRAVERHLEEIRVQL